MKYGASTFIWVSPFSNDSFYLFDKVKKQGFDLLEVCIEDLKTVHAKDIDRAARAAGVEVLICGAFGPERNISSESLAVREKGLDYIKQCCDIAQEVGSPLFSGPMYAPTGQARLLLPDERRRQWDLGVSSMCVAADYASVCGVKLAVETLNRFETDFINTVEQGKQFFQDIDRDNVGFLLDTFHMNIEEKSIPGAILQANEKMFHFHACANDRGTPGSGHIDWQGIKKAFDQIGYDQYAVIESFTAEITEIAKAVSKWRPLAKSPDDLATNGVAFLKDIFG